MNENLGERIDLMDDARNNPPLNDEGERAADTASATPRAQLPERDDLYEAARSVQEEAERRVQGVSYKLAEAWLDFARIADALYSRLAELEKDAARLAWIRTNCHVVLPGGRDAEGLDDIDAAMSAPTPKAEV